MPAARGHHLSVHPARRITRAGSVDSGAEVAPALLAGPQPATDVNTGLSQRLAQLAAGRLDLARAVREPEHHHVAATGAAVGAHQAVDRLSALGRVRRQVDPAAPG